VEWDGNERRERDDDLDSLAQEVRALSKTVVEMHRENLGQAAVRRDLLDTRLSQLADAINAMALAVQKADSALAQDLAVHIATSHHAGTLERLGAHEAKIVEHDAQIGRIKQRLGVDDGRHEAQTEARNWGYLRWGLIIAAVGALWQGITQLVSGFIAQLLGRGGS
jgi:hypothetical protein